MDDIIKRLEANGWREVKNKKTLTAIPDKKDLVRLSPEASKALLEVFHSCGTASGTDD